MNADQGAIGALPEGVDLPDVDDMAHSALQEALGFGLSHDTIKRHMHGAVMTTDAAWRAAWASHAARVPMPKSEEQAAGMVLLGDKWLREHAPQRLRISAVPVEFFAYGPDSGFETHKTAAEAEQAAALDVEQYREEAPHDGWPEGVDQVCWGVVLQKAKEVEIGPAPEGSEFDRIVDFVLAGEAPQAQASAAAVCDSVQVDDSGKFAASAFLARDVAELLGVEVLAVCEKLVKLGFAPRSANMAVSPAEAVALAKHMAPWRIDAAAPGRELVELAAGPYGWRYTVAESAKLLRAIDKNGGLCTGGEQYPNALNLLDMAGRLDVLLSAYPQLRAPAEAPARSEREIVEQTEELAAALMLWAHGSVPVDEDARFRDGFSPRAVSCWQMACKAQEILTNTDAENAADELDAESAASEDGGANDAGPLAAQSTQTQEAPVVWSDAAIRSLLQAVGDGSFGEEDIEATRRFMERAEAIRKELVEPDVEHLSTQELLSTGRQGVLIAGNIELAAALRFAGPGLAGEKGGQ